MFQNMILALENNLLSGLSATNEKLDLLNKRVSCIEMRLSDGDPRKAPQENDSGLFKPQSAASGVRPRVRPCLRRQKAVCPEDGFDTSSSDESFSINLEGTVYTVANTQPHPNYFVLYYINLIITRRTTLKYKDVRLKNEIAFFLFFFAISDLQGVCCNIYKDVLIQEHEPIINDVDLTNTGVLDRLLAEEAITSSDAEEIQLQGGRKEQTRSLLLMLEQRGQGPFISFVNALEPEYNHLHTTLKRSLSIMCKEKKHGRLKCIVCKIIENVSPREVIDKFYSQKIVTSKVMRDIQQSGHSIQGWEQLRPHIKNEEAIRVLAESLLPKFRGLREELDKFKEMTKFVCFCKRLSMKRKMEDLNKQGAIPHSPVEHSESLDSSEPRQFSPDSCKKHTAGGEELGNKFSELGFREKFHRQAIRKKDMKGKSKEETWLTESSP